MTSQGPLVVGIGASAGGIPALEGFFRALPDDSGMAFVIVTHLSPDRRSRLHEVIGRYTETPVKVAEDGAEVVANSVHIMPEGKILSIRNGRLQLMEDDRAHRERKPIDVFFAALAQDQGENAIGIVMSGGDSDGTLGVKAIKEGGGITMAQTEDGASGPRNPEMPHSAMASGLIDFAEPVERMPERLLQIRDGIDVLDIIADEEEDRQRANIARSAQADISALLRSHAGHDFSGYKHRTFLRRVARRMKVVQLTTLDDYIARLRDDSTEVMSLFRDLLINVTNFFRDRDAFAALESLVLPRLFEGRGADETIRIWVPGCATGEEVYSLGILMREWIDRHETSPRVQIFATDIDDEALSAARAGRYPDALLTEMSPERLKRFFRRDGASHVIAKEVREMCIFSPHSVISDPPFSRMDLVSCRNLLIYLGGELQNQVVPTFHYALKPGGFLFLGTSEWVSRHGALFAPLDKHHRIFQSRDHGGGRRRLPMAVDVPRAMERLDRAERGRFDATGLQLRQRVEAQVLDRHAPAHVVVTHEGEILYFSSNTGRYLEMPRGAPNRQFLDLARRDLRAELRAALRQAMETGRPAGRQVMTLDRDGAADVMVSLTVEPLSGTGDAESLFLVLFSAIGAHLRPETSGGDSDAEADADPSAQTTHAAMERELRDMRERLQSTIEEYETALEELKSSNEELVSVNEEAQSTNEELEASKEEMQSLNEELSTINAELATSVEELDRANSDLKNLYAATQIATVFLDGALVIRNFTPAAATFFNLRDADLGRPLTDLSGALRFPELEEQLHHVFETGETVERRLSMGTDRAHYLVRLMPYRKRDDGLEGAVVTIVDISSLARAEEQQEVLISELNHRVKNMLSVVISIANSIRRSVTTPGEYSDKLLARLHGMARAYSLLSEANWTGVSVRDLVHSEADAFGSDRIVASGPDVQLGPAQALSLSMIIHELATNAAKYGALSSSDGRTNVTWQMDGKRLTFKWHEQDGPAVVPPKENGFGLGLIEGQSAAQQNGDCEVEFREDGLKVDIGFDVSD